MIGSLRGTLLDRWARAADAKSPTAELLVEVAGVGYRVSVAPSTAVQLGEEGDEVFLHVYHHIREDAQLLFGFATKDERLTFEALIGAHGVGPALAMAILSVLEPPVLRQALLDDDVDSLCTVPGVGKKTAQRLLVELKGRLSVPDLAGGPSGIPAGAAGTRASARADVREGLVALGYSPDEVRDALADLPDEGEASALMKAALKRLAGARA